MNQELKEKIVNLLFASTDLPVEKLADQLLSLFESYQAEQIKAIEGLKEVILGDSRFAETLYKTEGKNWALDQVLSILAEKQEKDLDK